MVATVEAEAVRFGLAADWAADLEMPLAPPVHLDDLTDLTSPALFKGIQSTAGDAWLDLPITVERISLERLSLEKGTSIELEAWARLSIYSSQARLAAGSRSRAR